jgi:hypothetical protein
VLLCASARPWRCHAWRAALNGATRSEVKAVPVRLAFIISPRSFQAPIANSAFDSPDE